MAIIRRNEGGTPATRGEWDPFRFMQDVLRWEPFHGAWPRHAGVTSGGSYPFEPLFDVKETKDACVLKADLPGVKEGDLDISLSGNMLTVSGKRETEKQEEDETYFTCERSYGGFTRSFTLPEYVDAEHVRADLRDGVLTMVLPKRPEAQPKRITLGGGAKGEKAKA